MNKIENLDYKKHPGAKCLKFFTEYHFAKIVNVCALSIPGYMYTEFQTVQNFVDLSWGV